MLCNIETGKVLAGTKYALTQVRGLESKEENIMKKIWCVAGAAVAIVLSQSAIVFARGGVTPVAVPEPTTLMLVGVGLGGMALANRLRNRKK